MKEGVYFGGGLAPPFFSLYVLIGGYGRVVVVKRSQKKLSCFLRTDGSVA